jgi:hypothetical protein
MTDIFLVSSENKDKYCLDPIAGSLEKEFGSYRHVSVAHDDILKGGDQLDALATSRCPTVICASLFSLDLVRLIRGVHPFISVGIEHGLAPFKSYTYSRRFLEYDTYLAPTELWADRLKALYAPPANKVQVGGYPRLEVLRELRDASRQNGEMAGGLPYWHGVPKGKRKLVVLSWGIDETKISGLPDTAEIVYLIHPVEAKRAGLISFSSASAVVSSPEVAATLLAHADVVVGDFSSMTFEAAHLGLPTYFFICRELYRSNCDMSAGFFQRGSNDFAHIPHTHHQFAPENVLDMSGLLRLLRDSQAASILPAGRLAMPEGLLPPPGKDSRLLITEAVKAAVANEYSKRVQFEFAPESAMHRLRSTRFLLNAYREVLGRDADLGGLKHYLEKFDTSPEPSPLIAFKTLLSFAQSPEGRNRWAKARFDWPKIQMSPQASG